MRIFFEAGQRDDARREAVFGGAIFVAPESAAVKALREHGLALIREAFTPHDPQVAQLEVPVEKFVEIASALKTRFTNDADTKRLTVEVLESIGCDPATTYFDLPRLRIATAGGYLTAGVGYAYAAHRDTWYSSPSSQINYWFPVYDLKPVQALVFFPDQWGKPLENSSGSFDYQEWQRVGRTAAASQVSTDTRKHPLPKGAPLGEALQIATPAGTMLAFSSAQMHASPDNTADTTRFSIDFRSVNALDLERGRGAPLVDTNAKGSTLGDFLSMVDLSNIPDRVRDLVERREGAAT